jgi:nucleoside-diphosphate-sugar epimerase
LHLAWDVTPPAYWTAESNLAWVAASLELARLARAQGCQRFVAAGTCAEYDWSTGLCDETTTALAPASLYGIAKHSLHQLLAAWAKQFSVSFAWGRLFFLYGPGEAREKLVATVIRNSLAGLPTETTPGTQVRDFQHVADAGGALAALLDSTVDGPVNIASGMAISVADLVMRVADRLGTRALVKLGARPAPAGEAPRVEAAVQRLRSEVGWTDRHSLESGIDDAIAWWRAA